MLKVQRFIQDAGCRLSVCSWGSLSFLLPSGQDFCVLWGGDNGLLFAQELDVRPIIWASADFKMPIV